MGQFGSKLFVQKSAKILADLVDRVFVPVVATLVVVVVIVIVVESAVVESIVDVVVVDRWLIVSSVEGRGAYEQVV